MLKAGGSQILIWLRVIEELTKKICLYFQADFHSKYRFFSMTRKSFTRTFLWCIKHVLSHSEDACKPQWPLALLASFWAWCKGGVEQAARKLVLAFDSKLFYTTHPGLQIFQQASFLSKLRAFEDIHIITGWSTVKDLETSLKLHYKCIYSRTVSS